MKPSIQYYHEKVGCFGPFFSSPGMKLSCPTQFLRSDFRVKGGFSSIFGGDSSAGEPREARRISRVV